MKLEFYDVIESIKIHRNGSHWRASINGLNVELVSGTMGFRMFNAVDRMIESGVNKMKLTPEQLCEILKDPTLDVEFPNDPAQ